MPGKWGHPSIQQRSLWSIEKVKELLPAGDSGVSARPFWGVRKRYRNLLPGVCGGLSPIPPSSWVEGRSAWQCALTADSGLGVDINQSEVLRSHWRRRADSNRCIRVLQTLALTTWQRRLLVPRGRFELPRATLTTPSRWRVYQVPPPRRLHSLSAPRAAQLESPTVGLGLRE